MKRCPRCGETKSLDQFPPVRRGEPKLQSWCRACFAAYGAEYYRKNREAQKARLLRNTNVRRLDNRRRMIEYLRAHPCVDCGESDIVVLECDHRRDKDQNVATLVNGGATWQRLERELAKCEIRCANCHRRRHAAARGRRPRRGGRARGEQLSLSDAAERTCRACRRVLPLAAFPYRSKAEGTRHHICLDCQREAARRWYVRSRSPDARRNRNYGMYHYEIAARGVELYLADRGCVDCGERDPVVLEFDHQRDKIDAVSNLVVNGSRWEIVEQEIAKCEVRCANCHRRRTARAANAYRLAAATL